MAQNGNTASGQCDKKVPWTGFAHTVIQVGFFTSNDKGDLYFRPPSCSVAFSFYLMAFPGHDGMPRNRYGEKIRENEAEKE